MQIFVQNCKLICYWNRMDVWIQTEHVRERVISNNKDSISLLSIKCILFESNSDNCSEKSGILGAAVGFFHRKSHTWPRLSGTGGHPSQCTQRLRILGTATSSCKTGFCVCRHCSFQKWIVSVTCSRVAAEENSLTSTSLSYGSFSCSGRKIRQSTICT
jgi:hypothetical protein